MPEFTFIDNIRTNSGYPTHEIAYDGTYLYALVYSTIAGNFVIESYTFNKYSGYEYVNTLDTGVPGTSWASYQMHIVARNNVFYLVISNNGGLAGTLSAYSHDEGGFTLLDTATFPLCFQFFSVYEHDDVVTVRYLSDPALEGIIEAYSFDGSSFSYINAINTGLSGYAGSTNDAYYREYIAYPEGVQMHLIRFDGSDFFNIGSHVSPGPNLCWAYSIDESYIYGVENLTTSYRWKYNSSSITGEAIGAEFYSAFNGISKFAATDSYIYIGSDGAFPYAFRAFDKNLNLVDDIAAIHPNAALIQSLFIEGYIHTVNSAWGLTCYTFEPYTPPVTGIKIVATPSKGDAPLTVNFSSEFI